MFFDVHFTVHSQIFAYIVRLCSTVCTVGVFNSGDTTKELEDAAKVSKMTARCVTEKPPPPADCRVATSAGDNVDIATTETDSSEALSPDAAAQLQTVEPATEAADQLGHTMNISSAIFYGRRGVPKQAAVAQETVVASKQRDRAQRLKCKPTRYLQ